MKSMTGFGIAEYSSENEALTVEIKTINHRYKDFNFRLSRKLSPLEDNIRKYISTRLSRGHIEVNAKYMSFGENTAKFKYDPESAAAYKRILDTIAKQFPDADCRISVTDISRFTNVITSEEVTEDMEALWQRFLPVLAQACDMLEKGREDEGAALLGDFSKRISVIEEYTKKISSCSEDIPKAYYENLKKNISDFTGGVIDEQRMLTELALYADRCSITEELVRLNAHFENFRKTISLNEPVGRKLDFMLQEINREANTIASKSNSFEISSLVVEIKSELEKIREQVQNIE